MTVLGERLHTYERMVLNRPAHEEIVVPDQVARMLLQRDYYQSVGTPDGQLADYRRRLEDGRGIHLQQYPDHWEMHWDKVDPSQNLLGHLREDAPGVLAVGGILLLGYLAFAN